MPQRIIWRHILPNVLAPAVIITSFRFAGLIILEASLSFLSLGVRPPQPSWSGVLGEGREFFTTAWRLTTFPRPAIVPAALGANLTGDSIRDVLDPQLRKLSPVVRHRAGCGRNGGRTRFDPARAPTKHSVSCCLSRPGCWIEARMR